MAWFKSFVAKELRSVNEQFRPDPLIVAGLELCLLEGNSILSDGIVSRFPDQGHITSICSLEPP